MINHVSMGSNDMSRAAAFYDTVLATLGYSRVFSDSAAMAWGLKWPEFWIMAPYNGAAAQAGNGVHVAFIADSREAVQRFHAAAIGAGGTDGGPPGERDYMPGYYAAYVRDPDGNKIEACYMPDVPFPGG